MCLLKTLIMDSKGHQENILLPNIQHVGIGITKYNGSYRNYAGLWKFVW